MRTLLGTAIRIRGAAIWRSFDRATRDPRAAQARLLLNILRHNQDTEYGREHGFSTVNGGDAYAKAAPVNAFSDLVRYVEKMKKGRRNILTADPPLMFSVTSGTTDKPKFLPITPKGRNLAARVSRQWLSRALKDHPSFLDHSIFLVTGTAFEGMTPSGIPYGSASGMIGDGLPRALHRSSVLPVGVSAIEDYGLRYYLMTRLALAEEVSFIATPNPTTLIRIAETAIRYQDEIVRSIHDGVVSRAWFPGREREDPCILKTLGSSLRPNRPRARFLAAMIRRHGRLLPFACWKHLKLIGCWLGGSVGFQAAKLPVYYGEGVPKRDIGYLASEGSMTIPYRDNTPDGILALQNNYFEFVPEDAIGARDQAVLQCHEIEAGKRYKIILTNWNGLYRYNIDDVIEVHGFYNRAPVVAFVRKGDDILNITGEKLHVNHLLKTFRKLENKLGVTVCQFRVVPNYKKVRYEILMRLATQPSREYLKNTVLPFIDRSLGEVSIEYDAKRKSRRLLSPRVHVMSPSWEEDVRQHFLEAGHRDIQYKWRMTAAKISRLDAKHILDTIPR